MKTKITNVTYVIASLSRFLLAAAIMAVMFGILSSAIMGVTVQTTYTRFTGTGTVDFGSGQHTGDGFFTHGIPAGFGAITFDYNTSSGQLVATGRVRGTLYWDGLFLPGCARLTISFRNQTGGNLSVRNIDRCAPGGNPNLPVNQVQVDESFASTNLHQIRITTAEVSGGQLLRVTSQTITAPVSRQFSSGLLSSNILNRVDYNVEFNRSNVTMIGAVTGTLFTNVFNNCAQISISFRTINGSVLSNRTRATCGGNMTFTESLESGSLWRIHLDHINFSTTYDFNGSTGNFEVDPADSSVDVNEPLNYAFVWTVPEPGNWHDLQSLQLRIRDDSETVLWLHWDEASNSFSLFNQAAGRFGRAFPAGSNARLQTPQAVLDLSNTTAAAVNSVLGSGPASPSVLLDLGLSFKPPAAGRTYRVEVAARDDLGNEDPFALAGTLTVTP